MIPNDAQIDLLLRRHSRKGSDSAPAFEGSDTQALHLDADELNAFAEGALPAAARARYVSHLADCNDCRRLATQLTIAAGRTVEVRAETAQSITERASLWPGISNLFRSPNLRYAAFALVVVAAGITFIALRRGTENRADSPLVAEKTQIAPAAGSAVKATDEAVSGSNQNSQSPEASATPATSQNSNMPKQAQPGLAGTETRIEPAKELALDKNAPLEDKKKTEGDLAQAAPSYAPPPPGERAEPGSTEEQRSREVHAAAPAPKLSGGNFKIMERSGGADEAARNREMEANRGQSGQGEANRNQVAVNNSRPAKSPSSVARQADRDTAASQSQVQTQNQDAAASPDSDARKAGGHNFRRQGGAWVDTKFKSSMTIITIARGSDEFQALDSSVRSIAGQFNGEVIIVHKGKAYRIR